MKAKTQDIKSKNIICFSKMCFNKTSNALNTTNKIQPQKLS